MDRIRASITGAFGVPGENNNDRRKVEFCGQGLSDHHVVLCKVRIVGA